jgi:hypothetical protein
MLDVPSNWFVLSLAVADAVTCLALIFLVFIIDVKIGTTLIAIFAIIVQFAMFSSTGNLSLLTFNRFLSVYSSLRYTAFMTIDRAKRLVWVPWISAGLITVFLGYSFQKGIENASYIGNAYYTVLIIVISALNAYMFKQASDKRKVDAQNAVPSFKRKLLKREYRLFIRLLIVNLTFFGSCIPVMIMLYLYLTKESRHTSSFRHKITWFYLVSVLNAAIDPLVYSINHPVFKRYFNKFQNMLYSKPSAVPMSMK